MGRVLGGGKHVLISYASLVEMINAAIAKCLSTLLWVVIVVVVVIAMMMLQLTMMMMMAMTQTTTKNSTTKYHQN